MDSLLTYPDVNNLSTSSQPIHVRGLFSCRACWPRPHAVKPASRRSTAPANRAGCLAGVRCGRHASTVMRRVHRSLVAVHCRGRPRTPAHTRAHAHTTRPAHPRTRRGPHLRRIPVSAGLDARAAGAVCAARAARVSDSSWGSGWGCSPGSPWIPSASRSSSCPPSSPRRARQRGPGRRAASPRLPRR